jgi:hypothetical protein
MEEKKETAPSPKPQPKGPSKREKMFSAIAAIVFVVAVLIVALVQKANGAF